MLTAVHEAAGQVVQFTYEERLATFIAEHTRCTKMNAYGNAGRLDVIQPVAKVDARELVCHRCEDVFWLD